MKPRPDSASSGQPRQACSEATKAEFAPPPSRTVICGDALPWMRDPANQRLPGAVVVTSLPDLSELRLTVDSYERWLAEVVPVVLSVTPDDSGSLFFQSDVRVANLQVDKGALVVSAARAAGARVLFHKIVCRVPAGTLTMGRPGYTHLICLSRVAVAPDNTGIPDVIINPGRQPWVRAMGVRACAHAVRFARDYLAAKMIIDPFCGVGTVLAVANALGISALGIERSTTRSRQAQALTVHSDEL